METKPHVDNDPDVPDQVDIGRDVRGLPDEVPARLDMTAAVPLAMPVVVQSRPQVSCDPALPLPVYKGHESLMEDSPDVLLSGWESAVMMSDASRDICVEPDQLPVVESEEAVGPLAFTAVGHTKSQGGGALVVARPADEETISQVEVHQDLLSGQVMKSVDPDEESGDPMSLNAVPDVIGDACHAKWRETAVEDVEMEKFALVSETCPVVSMTSTVVRTFGPVLSEEYSPVVLAVGGAVAVAYPLAVVESDTARVSVLPMVESDTARVSVLPFAGSDPAGFLGRVALDVVGLGVGPSCLRVDSEETLPALLDERGMMSSTVPGVTLEDEPIEGA